MNQFQSKGVTRRRFLALSGAAALAGAFGHYLWNGTDTVAQNGAKTFAVGLRFKNGAFLFDPVALRLAPGDTISWFQISDLHSTTAYHPSNRKELRIPIKAKPWDSGILGTGGRGLTFSQKFDVEGVYDYFCIPHEALGMVGRFLVGKPDVGGPASKPVTQGIPAAGQKVLPTLEALTGLAGVLFTAQAEVNLPALRVFEKKPEDAKSIAETLLKEFEAGSGKNGSLFELLKQASLSEKYRAGLVQYRDLLNKSTVFSDVLKKADELKALLEEARLK